MIATKKRTTPGEISGDSLYTLAEIKARLGLGVHAMRAARGKGLVVRRMGRRSYVLGRDIIAFIEAGAKVGA